MKHLLIYLILCVSACSNSSMPTITDKTMHLDPSVYIECATLKPYDTSLTMLENNLVNMEVYVSCANKQKISVQLLKKFTNFKESAN